MSQAYAILTAAHVHTNTVKHNFKVDKNTTLLLWSSLSLPCIPWTWGVYGRTRGWQRSVVTSLSLTGSVLNHNHTITTRRPGARWACHYPGHNTNITPALSLYIYAQGASSGVWAVKVYFWMYSLHSERVAVGARQLWRQRVIVARQPDRPKMAELTGTGEQARFTLALTSLWQVSSPFAVRTSTPYDDYSSRSNCRALQQFVDGWQKRARVSTEGQREDRGRERSEDENLSLSAFPLKLTTSEETATKQSWQSHTLPQRNNKQQLERARQKLHEKERREGKKREMDRES